VENVTPKLYPLAAMCQAAQLVLQLATLGTCDECALHTQIDSLFALEPKNVEAIYVDIHHLDLGLAYFDIICHHPLRIAEKAALRMIYSFSALAKKILMNPNIAENLKSQLHRIQEQSQYFGSWDHPRVMQNLGDTYLELANRFNFRLKISGQKKYLQDLENIHKIRAALLSGVRAAVLWHQMKGSFLWAIWHRKTLVQEARQLLKGTK
jgi:high frequency lysogenization protein